MEEFQALIAVCEYLESKGHRYFIDPPKNAEEIDTVLDNLPGSGINNTIKIGRRTPDVVGYNNDDEIIAIEVKGGGDPRKGIGQAAHYRMGVHRSYLAAPEKDIDEFSSTISSCGVGTLRIDSSHDGGDWAAHVDKTDPVENLAATELNKTRRGLAIKTSDFEGEQDAFSSLTHPLNALLPVVSIGINDAVDSQLSYTECKQTIENHEYGLGSSTLNHAFALSRTLQLIRIDGSGTDRQVSLTDTGQMGYLLLQGRANQINEWSLGIDRSQAPDNDDDSILFYLKKIKIKRGGPAYEYDAELTAFLRDRYLAIPDVRYLINILASQHGETAELSHILSIIAFESPEVFLNLFLESGTNTEKEFQDLLETSAPDPDKHTIREQILRLSSKDALYNFVSQLSHIHLLQGKDNAVHQSDYEELEIGDQSWTWDSKIVGDLGFEI